MHAAVAVQAALAHRERTGDGQLIEVAQLETGANLTAELVIEWSSRQVAVARDGNHDPVVAPQGVYSCRADGPIPEWAALTVADDEQWTSLCEALGRRDWIEDESLANAGGRRARHDELDEAIAAWTDTLGPEEVVAALRPVGTPVARILSVPMMTSDPQLAARGFYVELDHAVTGIRRYPGWPMHFSFTREQQRFGAPTLGQHNREVLTELGLDEAAIAELERDGVIGDRMTAG
jgi:crotonobetainyl-CoA:carnitine CoA-transferase CaiB-like acyl-CoA transferase